LVLGVSCWGCGASSATTSGGADAAMVADGPTARPADAPVVADGAADGPADAAARLADAPPLIVPDAEPHDAGALGSSVSPPSGASLAGAAVITLSFPEPLDRATLTLGGTLAPLGQASFPAATQIAFRPKTAWPEGNATLVVSVADVLGDQAALQLVYLVDATAPTATLRSGDLVLTMRDEGVVIRYSETMRRVSLTLGGTLVPGAVTWSGFIVADDTLAIDPPASGWPNGGTLTVDATDLAGNPANTMRFSAAIQ
jgi:hypothetical protein